MPVARSRDWRSRAQSLVELAFVLPSAMFLLLGAADLGRAFYESQAIHEAVQVGALVAMDHSRDSHCSPVACAPAVAPCFSDIGVTCANDQVICAITAALPWQNGGSDCRTPNSKDTITLGTTANPSGPWTAADWVPDATFVITMNHTFNFITPFLSTTQTRTLTATVRAERNALQQ
jgi:hypothetical protein